MLIPVLSICHRCPSAELNQEGFKGGACACTSDPQRRDITVLAAAGECPKNQFKNVSLARGVVGVVKAVAGIDRAPDEVIAKRRETCEECNKGVVVLGVLRRCDICGCALRAKIVNAGEKCPLGKW